MQETSSMDYSKSMRGGEHEMLHVEHSIPPARSSHAGGQTLVVVGTETAVLREDSPVRKRIIASVRAFQEVHIIVLCGGDFPTHAKIEDHIFLHPTNSRTRLKRVWDAVRLGRALPRADIVTVQDPFETGLAGWLIARKLGATLHVQIHTDFLSPAFAALSLLNRVRVALARFVLCRANGIRVVSERIKESLKTVSCQLSAVRVLPIFVDVERMSVGLEDRTLEKRFAPFTHRVLIVSRLEPEKNVACAIRAFATRAPKSACLLVVGDGRDSHFLQDLAKDLGIASRVFFEGAREATLYYSLADLVLVPSKYEGYGLVIVEALAAGKPVISTDVGIAREAGAIVTTEEHFADALAEWFKNGSRTGELKYRPYRDFEEYVQKYVEDISACATSEKSQ